MEKLPTASGLEPENKCLGSLFMKLEGVLVPSVATSSRQSEPQQLKLHLTLQFREQRELLVGGHIKFGLKGGRLRVKLKNAEIPLTSNQLGRSYELAVPKKKPADTSPQTNLPTTETKSVQFISCKVAVRGTPTRPIWVFAVDKGGSVLKGTLKNTTLATIDITSKPCYIEAIFEVAPRDIHLSEAEGLWPKNLSKKKSVVIERAIVRRFMEQNLAPYLSRQIMRYD
jgi:hypothetical protein